MGIAVGMATNIPPHNLGEVCDALVYLLDNPKATTEDLFQFIKGPDFPLGGEIFDKEAILAAYSQGKGPIVARGKAEIVHLEKMIAGRLLLAKFHFRCKNPPCLNKLLI